MPWLQLRINASRDQANLIEEALTKHGSLSVTLEDNADQPIFEPELGETPLWQQTRITGLFDASIDTDTVLNKICHMSQIPVDQSQWQILEDKDWEREWMTHYHPIQIHDNFWICPSWSPVPDDEAINLMLDPGLAFGTGTHPTTFLCLEWIAQQDLSNKTVIDYGCGSGILGIAALLKQSKKVIGTDIDPQALIATQNNVKRNGLQPEQFPVFFPKQCPEITFDFVFANILAGPLVELAETFANLLLSNGKLCLSGILNTQKTAIIEAYSPFFHIDDIVEKEEWLCITGTRL